MSVIRPRLPEDPLIHEVVAAERCRWKPEAIAGRLEAIRGEILADPRGVDLPTRLLEEYMSRRLDSRMAEVLAEATRLRDTVDRLVIVAGGSIARATRLLVSACCHPFHDHLPRGERGGRPRLTWVDADADNDRLQGILDVVAPEGRPPSIDLLDQWAILAIDEEPSEPFPRVAAGVFSAASLLPASIVGINVVRLLEGAAAMQVRFAEAPLETNPVLADAAMRWRAAREEGREASLFLGGGPALAELTAWAGHIRPAPAGAAAVVAQVVIEEPRRGCLMPPRDPPAASMNHPITIRLPRLDEHALGQLLELVILSAVVERRLNDGL